MEDRRADVTAFQLAAELASNASTSASASPPLPNGADENVRASHQRSTTRSERSTGKGNNTTSARQHGARAPEHQLLEDQRRSALRGGASSHGTGATHAAASSSSSLSSLKPPHRIQRDMYGRTALPSAESTTSALLEAVRRWGLGRDDDNSLFESSGGAASASSSPLLRYSWRLVEAGSRRTAVAGTASPLPNSWSLGQRWERSDDVTQANALLRSLQHEATQRRSGTDNDDSSRNALSAACDSSLLYESGLRLCAESARGAASLAACLAATSSPSLAFFTFSEEEYNALRQPSLPLLHPQSTFTFTYASACYLFELWSRFGNPVVVVDRWAFGAKRREHAPQPQQQARPCVFASPPHDASANTETEGVVPPCPTVEQVCAEYSRVTSGVLQQRQQCLLQAVLALQDERQQQQDSTPTSGKPAAVSAAEASRRRKTAKERTTFNAAVNAHTSFIASFGRYALLRSTAEENRDNGDKGDDEAATTTTAEPSPPPSQALAVAAPILTARDEHTSEVSRVSVQPVAAAASPLSSTEALPPPQRLAYYTTPHPWYQYGAEAQRRAAVRGLLLCEGATNMPYQHAAAMYLTVATSAAQALQRASFVFDDRDREEEAVEEKEEETARLHGAHNHENDAAAGAGDADASFCTVSQGRARAAPSVPPRHAFAVQLQPLPNVDPVAWKAAAAALRRAAAAVLGTAANSSRAVAVEKPGVRRCRPTHPAKRARSGVSAKCVKRRVEEGGRTAAAAGVAQTPKEESSIKTESAADDDDDDDVVGGLREGSSESLLAAQTDSSASKNNENDLSDSSNSSTDDGGDDNDDDKSDSTREEGGESDDATPHLSQDHDAVAVESEEGFGDADELLQTPLRKRSGRTRSVARGGGARRRACNVATFSSSPSPAPQPAHLPSDPSYRTLQAYITDVVPFRCTRLRVAAQAGWLLPPPLPAALPHSLTDRLDEKEVVLVDVRAAQPLSSLLSPSQPTFSASRDAAIPVALTSGCDDAAGSVAGTPSACHDASPNNLQEDLYRPILSEDDYQELRKVSAAAVCNRVVSHTGEAVLLSLPPTLPRLHREVEQELERYLYDDTSAMMEVNATAQSLLAQIRVAYTQNTYLQRYAVRLEHVVENLKKVEQDCKDAGRG